jgi:hypothetical protein
MLKMNDAASWTSTATTAVVLFIRDGALEDGNHCVAMV